MKERVYPVGRLDWHSEGLLILTNDGDLAYQLTQPSNHIAKVYGQGEGARAEHSPAGGAAGALPETGRKSLPAQVRRITARLHSWLEITLYEGQKNQIRRTFERLGHPVFEAEADRDRNPLR